MLWRRRTNLALYRSRRHLRCAWLFLFSMLLGWSALACLDTMSRAPGETAVFPAAVPAGAAVVYAQDAGAPGAAAPAAPAGETSAPKRSLFDQVSAGGWIGGIIILCSIIGFSLAITFAFQLRRDSLVPPEVLDQVEQFFEEENYEEAYAVCESTPSFFSAILAAGLAKIDRPYEEVEEAMVETGEFESNKLHQKVGYLSLIAAISPMLGLFGTVYGMIKTFDVIAGSQSQPSPQMLAGGISLALVTTFMGLLVAIPMTVLFVVFRNKVVSTVLEVGALTEELMDRFKGSARKAA